MKHSWKEQRDNPWRDAQPDQHGFSLRWKCERCGDECGAAPSSTAPFGVTRYRPSGGGPETWRKNAGKCEAAKAEGER